MAQDITIRPASRGDIQSMATIANAANAKSVLHRRVAPWQDRYPLSYHHWRLLIIRQRFVTPNLRNFIAEDASKHILGVISIAVEGSDEIPLFRNWTREITSSWWNVVEAKLIEVEKWYDRVFTQKSIDYEFLQVFFGKMMSAGDESRAAGKPRKKSRPACLHVHQIVVDPQVHARGVGRRLIDVAKALAVKEDLPLFLESNLEATGFYDKGGFLRLTRELVVDVGGDGEKDVMRVPMYVWEGEGRTGRWVERDGEKETWRWRDDVLV